MKVMHVEAGRHLYGGAFQVLLLLEGLRGHGVENVLVCPPDSAVGREARAHGSRVVPLALRGDHDLAFVAHLRRLLRRERPDILHLHSRRGADVLGGLAGRLAGVPSVLSRRVDNPEPAWLARGKYRLFRRVITISEAIRRVLLEEGVPAERLVCVPSAVDTERYRPEPEPAWFRHQFGLGADEGAVGMVAQFIPRKGHATLVDAAERVLAEYPRTRFLLFGQGPEREAIQDRVRRAGVAGRFVFAGFRADLPRVLPNLDVLAHPADKEGLGVALLQAGACGVPAVATPVGGIPEVVADGETGRLVPPGDADALATVLGELLGNAELRQRMGAAARERVSERFSVEAMVRGNLAVYRSVVGS